MLNINFTPVQKTNCSLLNFTGKTAKKELEKDTFEKETLTYYMDVYGTFEGKRVKRVVLQDYNGNNVKASILQDTKKPDYFFLCTKDRALCMLDISNRKNDVRINGLWGQHHNGEFAGAGTELLKFAVEKSRKLGHKGRLSLLMAGSFPFYWKNNFKVSNKEDDFERKSAALDYLTRHDDMHYVWNPRWGFIEMSLDEKGADALMKGKRLHLERNSETMYEKQLEYKTKYGDRKIKTDIDFCDYSNKKWLFQAVEKTPSRSIQTGCLEVKLKNEKGEDCFEIGKFYTDMNLGNLPQVVEDELIKAAMIKKAELLDNN